MKHVLVPALALAFAAAGPVLASEKLAQEKQCMQCHAVDKDTIGPSFKKIQAIYKGTKGAETKLIAVMRQGSDANLGPHWGKARMPNDAERPTINDAEAKKIARWILKLPA